MPLKSEGAGAAATDIAAVPIVELAQVSDRWVLILNVRLNYLTEFAGSYVICLAF